MGWRSRFESGYQRRPKVRRLAAEEREAACHMHRAKHSIRPARNEDQVKRSCSATTDVLLQNWAGEVFAGGVLESGLVNCCRCLGHHLQRMLRGKRGYFQFLVADDDDLGNRFLQVSFQLVDRLAIHGNHRSDLFEEPARLFTVKSRAWTEAAVSRCLRFRARPPACEHSTDRAAMLIEFRSKPP